MSLTWILIVSFLSANVTFWGGYLMGYGLAQGKFQSQEPYVEGFQHGINWQKAEEKSEKMRGE